MTPPRRFQYNALRGANSTRLIKLFPAPRRESTICIELSEFTLDSGAEYEALSYTWDGQRPTREVICSGTTLLVTENVFLALQRLRSKKGQQRILWIDSISINQKDEAEKTVQVSNMGQIFARAKRVNIWLSRATSAMEGAFEYLRLADGPEIQMPRIPDVYIPELKDGICQLCSHPYWTRIWTVQEVALNDNCWIYLGKLKPMEMLTFRGMLYEAEGYMNQTWEGLVQQEPGSLYPVSFRRGSPHSTTTLHEPWNGFTTDDILHNLIAKKARNPLDLVFACRDLLPESFGQIKVDYTRAISDLLREATSRIIPGLRSLGILLSLVCHCPPVPGVPSWTLTLQFDLQLHDVSHYFGVWFPTPPHATTPNTAHVLPDGKTLRARGIIVDHVAFVSDEFPYYTLQHQETWHRHVHALLKRSKASIKEYLTHEFEEAMVYILYAAVTAGEDLAAKIHEFARFEKVHVIDEDGTLLTNTVYKVHRVEDLESGNLDDADRPSSAGRVEMRQARLTTFSKWMEDPSVSPFRLDTEATLSCARAEGHLSTAHSPALNSRSLFVTAKGLMGLGKRVQPGDAIALITTCEIPFALRPVPGTSAYTLGQPAVLEDVMMGEQWPADNETGLEAIEIV